MRSRIMNQKVIESIIKRAHKNSPEGTIPQQLVSCQIRSEESLSSHLEVNNTQRFGDSMENLNLISHCCDDEDQQKKPQSLTGQLTPLQCGSAEGGNFRIEVIRWAIQVQHQRNLKLVPAD